MATIINPITTVLLNRAELESGEFERFPFKYILEEDGTITYFSKLSAGRYVLSHEAQITGLGTNRKVKAPAAEFQALANEYLVPGEMFYQIKQFFLDVMDLGPSTYEAQVFIVWNTETEEYRIVIPKQKVSAAAVRYDIGDILSDTDIIIVDIHSHNNMSAFFSGTDNADDKKNPWISGVFGKLSTAMEHKFRFNDGCGRHFDMVAGDVFDFEDARFQTPQSWLDQVEISAYTPVKNSAGVRKWDNNYQHPNDARHWADNWVSPAEKDVGVIGDQFSEIFFDDPEADLYDGLVDSLADYSNEEIRTVLDAAEQSLASIDYAPTITDREMTAYLDVSYTLHNCGDRAMASSVLNQLRVSY